ncbi:hypothetical protein EP342_02035 [bacterium]|nr:MAG: hypothetical protein EP342_02035 [bacterium]
MYNELRRYSILIGLLLLAWIVLSPGIEEIHTLLIIILVEIIAIGLSALAVYGFTRIDFTHDIATNNLGYIFLGVHICVGFTVLGVYLVQFS